VNEKIELLCGLQQTFFFGAVNDFRLMGFGVAGQEAVALVTPHQHERQHFYLALVSLDSVDIQDVIDWLKSIKVTAAQTLVPVFLGIHFNPLLLPQADERVRLLQHFMDVVDTVIVIPQLENDTPAQALARMPQFLNTLSGVNSMYPLIFSEINPTSASNLAFFGYSSKNQNNGISTLVETIHQQWQSTYLPSAFVRTIVAGVECNFGRSDEPLAIEKLLSLSKPPCLLDVDVSIKVAMILNSDMPNRHINLGVLFFGLDFG
jgi:hypothetical protein